METDLYREVHDLEAIVNERKKCRFEGRLLCA